MTDTTPTALPDSETFQSALADHYQKSLAEANASGKTGGAAAPASPEAAKLRTLAKARYKKALEDARSYWGRGAGIRTFAGGLFLICAAVSFLLSNEKHGVSFLFGGESAGGTLNVRLAWLLMLLSAAACLPAYLMGVLVSVQGRAAHAAVHTAINTSRHLTDEDVAGLLQADDRAISAGGR